MSPRERLWPGYSTEFEKEARDAQSGRGFKKWRARYERGNNGFFPVLPESPRADLKAFYRVGDGTLVKGCELSESILPVNLQPTTPSLFERVRKELNLLFKR